MTKLSTRIEAESSRQRELESNFPIGSLCERKKGGESGLPQKSCRAVGFRFTVKGYKYGDSVVDEKGNIHKCGNIKCITKKPREKKVETEVATN
jgi:hypothetical protein